MRADTPFFFLRIRAIWRRDSYEEPKRSQWPGRVGSFDPAETAGESPARRDLIYLGVCDW